MLTQEQSKALEVLYERYTSGELISILQGPAGSGKTTAISAFLTTTGLKGDEVAFVTFTGTAAKILSSKGSNAQTIHSLIYKPIMKGGVCVGFSPMPQESLSHLKLIIVDEFSMVSQEILDDLMKYKIPIILIGDKYQLPPIDSPNKFVNQAHVELTEIHRQALDNPILWAANQIRLGEPLLNGVYGDKLFVGRKHEADESWFRKDVQILAGLNRTRDEINQKIIKRNYPMVGDKIIFLSNDWKHNITNGTKATLLGVARAGYGYRLNFKTEDGMQLRGYRAYFKTSANPRHQTFDFAYCITTHKAQGSTIDQPGIIFDESSYFGDYRRNWLYTALTRFSGNYRVAILR